jgi:hypothetical protein
VVLKEKVFVELLKSVALLNAAAHWPDCPLTLYRLYCVTPDAGCPMLYSPVDPKLS